MTASLTIGIDIGTGSIKALVLDNQNTIVDKEQIYYPAKTESSSQSDPEMIFLLFIQVLNTLITRHEKLVSDISLSSCMHSLILIDKDWKPLTSLITWEDLRSAEIAENIRNADFAKSLYEETGTPIHAMTPLTKIMWFRDHDYHTYSITHKFISIKEFIWYRLFQVSEVDVSIAAATGLFNLHNFNWNKQSLELCGISYKQLSEIVPCDHRRLYINDTFDFLKGVNFSIGSSDGCMANIGSYTNNSSQVAITIGTSAAVRFTNSRPWLNYSIMSFCYPIDKNMYICGCPVNNGGNIIHWLIKTYLNISNPQVSDYEKYFALVSSISAGSDGLQFFPCINGERAPYWDETLSGAFIGIKKQHTTSHFLRAGLEGVCFALNNLMKLLDFKNEINEIHISGGLIHSQVFLQMMADVLNKKMIVTQTEDASAFGAALFIKGSLKSNPMKTSGDKRSTTPSSPSSLAYRKYQTVFDMIHEDLKRIHHSLNQIT